MQPQRQTMTDRLADVIHIIHVGSKSGVLTVERGEGKTREEGSITFVNGRVIEARVGSRNGLAAFNYLNVWQTCRFSLLTREASASLYTARLSPIIDTQKNSIPDKTSVSRAVPLRERLGEEMIQQSGTMQLSRLHRHLLLLIDGQRGRSDLARLMSRSADEVQELLNDLERDGLIRQ